MSSQKRWAVCLLFALGAIPVGTRAALAATRTPTHVACVGDSITAGAGASSARTTYPGVLQTLLGDQVQVQNFGHSGATMLSDGFGDLPYEDQPEYPAATDFVSHAGPNAVVDVIIMLGTNDSKPFNWTPAGKPKNDQQYLTDYRAMVQHFSALTPRPQIYLALPLATGPSPCCEIDGAVIHDQVLPLIRQLASEQALPLIDLNTPSASYLPYLTDGVHPNDAGYAVVAQIMRNGILGGSAGGASGGATAAGGSAGGATAAGAAGGATATGGSAGGAIAAGGSPIGPGASGTAPSRSSGCNACGVTSSHGPGTAPWGVLAVCALVLRNRVRRRRAPGTF